MLIEYYFLRHHEWSLCSLVYCGPPTKKNPVVWACVAEVDIHARGSPLIQCGLEIPVEVTVTMPYSEKNRAALDKYEELVKKHYPEPEVQRSIQAFKKWAWQERNLILASTKLAEKSNEYPLI